jgi:hypothetical protein
MSVMIYSKNKARHNKIASLIEILVVESLQIAGCRGVTAGIESSGLIDILRSFAYAQRPNIG